ncbi:cupin domain-containing protein [bacterium]|nr:cupin domain-containing protein [bacterium]MBU1880918.1 cupin domain-containing protein [bacterium]
MIFKRKDAFRVSKHSVAMEIYNGKEQCPQAAVAYQETETGHAQEFAHNRSAFIFYIIEGAGTWYIEDQPYEVEATDVVIVPPGKKFYYKGKLKQICITAPAWEEEYETQIRPVDL